MNGSGRIRRRRSLLWLAPVVVASIAIPAGRSDAAEGKVSATTVVEGLKTIQQGLQDAVAAGKDTAKARQTVEAVEPVWSMIEATIKGNDAKSQDSLWIGIEDLEAAIKSGDAGAAGGAVSGFAAAAKSYVANFPATAAAGTSTTPARTANAAPAADRSAAAPKPDAAGAPAAGAGDAALARTGTMSDTLAALAGLALALGGLSIIGGARRRPSPIA